MWIKKKEDIYVFFKGKDFIDLVYFDRHPVVHSDLVLHADSCHAINLKF